LKEQAEKNAPFHSLITLLAASIPGGLVWYQDPLAFVSKIGKDWAVQAGGQKHAPGDGTGLYDISLAEPTMLALQWMHSGPCGASEIAGAKEVQAVLKCNLYLQMDFGVIYEIFVLRE
jgi:hypothetical protein